MDARSPMADAEIGGPGATPFGVSALFLTAFRNYAHLSLRDLPLGPIVLTGANGSGKTNLLEAVSMLIPGRGLRSADMDLLTRSSPQPANDAQTATAPPNWAVAADVVRDDPLDEPVRIGTGPDPQSERSGRTVRIDQTVQPIARLSDHLAQSWLTPAHDGLFTGPAGDRRRYMDRLVAAVDPQHTSRVNALDRLLRQRNKLLENMNPDERWLDAIEGELAGVAVSIAASRITLVDRLREAEAERRALADLFPPVAMRMGGLIEDRLPFESATASEDHYCQILREGRPQDARAGRTLQGVHRSDLEVIHLAKGTPAHLASTGEQKALLIGMTLAHARVVARSRNGRVPILLLDEISAHLDDIRRAALFQTLLQLGGQSFLTGTDRESFSSFGDQAYGFDVVHGTLTPWD